MKIGILGGSFDPIHNGHLHMAECAYEQYELDEIWLIPNGHAPHKDEDRMADAVHRLNMCQLVAQQYNYMRVNDIEIQSEESSYTYLTLQKLHVQHPEHEFYFIMGADSLDYFEKWKNPEIIAELCTILVINRDEFDEEDMQEKINRLNTYFPADIRIVHCQKVSISSTELRQQLDKIKVHPAVYDYICKYGLYL